MLSSDEGRARFWAESAVEHGGVIHFQFPDGSTHRGRVLRAEAPGVYSLVYYGDTECTFTLSSDGEAGTVLELTDRGVPAADLTEVTAGWVSVLMALKAAVDHDVDLRNHHQQRTWADGFADN